MIKIGVDASCWWSNRGFGRFTRQLLLALFDEYKKHTFILFVDREPEAEMVRDNVEIVRVKVSRTVTQAAVAEGNRSLRDVWAFTRAVKATKIDIMFYPAVYSWYPVLPRLKNVVTLHDAIAERFPELIFPDWKGRMLWSAKMKLARWQATRVMTVSHAAKEEIVEYLGENPSRIDVVSEAADPRFKKETDAGLLRLARKRANLPLEVRLIVYVGGLAPHKNLSGFMKGLSGAIAHGEIDDVHLALVGDIKGDGFHSHYEELAQQAKNDVYLDGKVHFTGFVSDEDLVRLYSDAMAVALPSFSEGFGLPAIESMACGVPVLASRAGSVPEVVGDAGLYFDPYKEDEITQAVLDIATCEEKLSKLRAAATARSTEFTWSRAAKLTMDCLRRTMDS